MGNPGAASSGECIIPPTSGWFVGGWSGGGWCYDDIDIDGSLRRTAMRWCGWWRPANGMPRWRLSSAPATGSACRAVPHGRVAAATAAAFRAPPVGPRTRGDQPRAVDRHVAAQRRCAAGTRGVDHHARGAPQRRPGCLSRGACRSIGARAWSPPKLAKLLRQPRLCHEVEQRLARRWSPQQIAASLVADYPDDAAMRISHETIYQSLFIQSRGALRRERTRYLRRPRHQRRPAQHAEGRGRLADMINIRERPAEMADRAVPRPLGR